MFHYREKCKGCLSIILWLCTLNKACTFLFHTVSICEDMRVFSLPCWINAATSSWSCDSPPPPPPLLAIHNRNMNRPIFFISFCKYMWRCFLSALLNKCWAGPPPSYPPPPPSAVPVRRGRRQNHRPSTPPLPPPGFRATAAKYYGHAKVSEACWLIHTL